MSDELDPRWDGVVIWRADWHFHRRLFSRYGLVLEPGEYSSIMKGIRARKVWPIETKRGASTYYVRFRKGQRRIYVVSNGERLLTALPRSRRLKLKRMDLVALESERRQARREAGEAEVERHDTTPRLSITTDDAA